MTISTIAPARLGPNQLSWCRKNIRWFVDDEELAENIKASTQSYRNLYLIHERGAK